MNTPKTEPSCGLCGAFISRRKAFEESPWLTYYRAIYCTGSNSDEPRLSGLAFYREEAEVNYMPPEAHQRFDDLQLNPLSFIAIQGVCPPGPDVPKPEKEVYAWGFQFHDSCWRLLEQAGAPQPVDLKALWRILLSVPHVGDVPNWGHNYGGLYLSSRRAQEEGNHFFCLGGPSNLLIPSVYHDPFKVPELEIRLARWPVRTDDKIPTDEKSRPVTPSPTTPANFDPFSRLPVEIREILLTYVATQDTLSFRLSSRAIAVTPLSNFYFQSRFWSGREVDVFFDGFLLKLSDKAAIDWKELYVSSKRRLTFNLFGVGERNRLRIWKQTVRPLMRAMDEVSRLSNLKGQSNWSQDLEDGRRVSWSGFGSPDQGSVKRHVIEAEIYLPSSNIEVVHVSFIDFFGTKYVSGLRFTTEHGEYEIGYILPDCEESLAVESGLRGFGIAIDGRGFVALAVYTGQHMTSQYLDVAGDRQSRMAHHIGWQGRPLRRLRATFDGFRMQSLQAPHQRRNRSFGTPSLCPPDACNGECNCEKCRE
ncbi:hypothetical protein HD806DRAFT_493703 [Xylariaceae sp. AK1471]|nr:hypothetical protein HD806DRAFT_493703 [Xylariaceae sp. AK1471]